MPGDPSRGAPLRLQPVRIAVIGLGFMGATHARAWQQVQGAHLTAVVSRDERKLAGDLSGTEGNLGTGGGSIDLSAVRKYRALDDALLDPEIDAVDLCMPTSLHFETVVRALRAGKHVLVEKPLALEPEEARALVEEAKATGRVLMCAHVLRFFPAYVKAREAIKTLGPVRGAFFRRRCAAPGWSDWLLDPARSGGGAFDLLIHDVDYVRWLMGMPDHVTADRLLDESRGIDLVTGILRYGDATVTITGGWQGFGESPFSAEFTIVYQGKVLESADLNEDGVDPFAMELAHFAHCVSEGRQSDICPANESADAVALMRRLLQEGGK